MPNQHGSNYKRASNPVLEGWTGITNKAKLPTLQVI